VLLAPLCRDLVRSGREPAGARAGGAGLYAAWALASRGADVTLHTPLADRDRDLLDALPRGVRVIVHPSRLTTRFRLEVEADDPDRRRLFLEAASDPIDPSRIGSIESAAHVLLAPLWPSDLDHRLIEWLHALQHPYDLGVQGLVRSADARGAVGLDAGAAPRALPAPRILAGDEREIASLPTRWSAGETITTLGSRGARIELRGVERGIEIPAERAVRTRHAIGLGDTFLAVYGWERSCGVPPPEAGTRAAGAARELLEHGLSWEA
jgi:sugar/nucleoside kinase (ribokinase family)